MSFRRNDSQQMSFFDNTYFMTKRERKALEASWATIFADEIFPQIDEERFRCLYSSNDASRPNTPTNVVVGALILQQLFNLSDDEMVERLMFDIRFQYALHTTSFKEQPLSDKTLSRFRARCYEYEQKTNIDLMHDCVKDLAGKTARMMAIDGHIRRMDSMMVASDIKKLSRAELIYRCISNTVKFLQRSGMDELIGTMAHYCEPNDFNRVFYHANNPAVTRDDIIQTLLKDADALLARLGDTLSDIKEYKLLVRVLSEQTIVENGVRRLRTKEDGGMGSDILQNPADPEATYRKKAGKEYRGYVANVEESVGKNASQITEYQFEQNNVSDQEMAESYLEGMDHQEEKVLVSADGAYSSDTIKASASAKNIDFAVTDLTGKEVDPVMGAFSFNEDGTTILSCPAGKEPESCKYNGQTGQCTATYAHDTCAECPFRSQCKAKNTKNKAKVTASVKMRNRARQRASMSGDRFKALSRFRNGVETIPSQLRRNYNLDHMPVRGKTRMKFFFGTKVAALNFRKLFNFRKGLGNYAQNELINAVG